MYPNQAPGHTQTSQRRPPRSAAATRPKRTAHPAPATSAASMSPEFRSALQDPIQAYTLLKSRVDALEAQKHAMQDLRLALRQSEQDVRDHVQACDNLRSELVRAKQTISRLQMENKRLSVFAQSAQGQDNAVVGK
ncbi:hypothetical protein BD626DRAFT_579542 [Schizophyllum amplum]|uniref:Uncharacterized protein n=1 Tax=Schizophyllum amplum TaxID=97359 RepID=A0A550BRE5_9AGAR|nr:hypothetical protein BD626DRAFT_579542 [Auriculariopsis ampla]